MDRGKEYGWVTRWGTPMFGDVTALEGLHVIKKYGKHPSSAHRCTTRPQFSVEPLECARTPILHVCLKPATCQTSCTRMRCSSCLCYIGLDWLQRLGKMLTCHFKNGGSGVLEWPSTTNFPFFSSQYRSRLPLSEYDSRRQPRDRQLVLS